MPSTPALVVAAAALCTLAATVSHRPSAQAAEPGGSRMRLEVPAGDGAPVITDGIFSPGEWDDARRVALSADVTLHVKHHRGVVFVGLRGLPPLGVGPSELSLAVPGGTIHKLHVSAALYEVLLPDTAAPEPPPRLGLTTGWYANELRRDDEEVARLQRLGTKNPFEIISATSYPSDGIEFAIRRSKFPGSTWLARLSVSLFVGGKPSSLTYPPAAAERATGGWLELRLM
jgi:hypothetical protein